MHTTQDNRWNHEAGGAKPGMARGPLLILLVVAGCLVPFLTKAYHMDDSVYLWVAQYIRQHPFDFYGFAANWYGFEMPMYLINQNPPMVSYALALASLLVGWNEFGLHLLFMVPAIAAGIGTWHLASLLCRQPLIAALVAVLTPVFIVSASTLMADTLMLACYVWAAALWVHGIHNGRHLFLAASAVITALAVLTKYFGITLIPLLFVYGMLKTRRIGLWSLYLFFPAAVLLGYQWLTQTLYGVSMFSAAAGYASAHGLAETGGWIQKTITGLSFTGGCMVTLVCFFPFILSRRSFAGWLGLTAALTGLFYFINAPLVLGHPGNGSASWPVVFQLALFVSLGTMVVAAAVDEAITQRSAEAWLLFFWIAGTLLFATYINWTTNARALLPMVPPVGILLARRIERRQLYKDQDIVVLARWSLMVAALFSISVGLADHAVAGAQRDAAMRIRTLIAGYPYSVWFQGHWGFQYYMENIGARPLDFHTGVLNTGDIIVIPMNGGNIRWTSAGPLIQVATFQLTSHPWIATMQNSAGAGFYSDRWGMLPFVVGSTPNENFRIVLVGEFDAPLAVASAFRDAVEQNPEAPDRFHALSQAIERHSSDTAKHFNADKLYGTPLNPPSYYVHTGNLLRRTHRLDLAAANYEKALSLAPDNLSAMKGLGIVYGIQGEFDKAVNILRQAASANNTDPNTCYLVAAMFAKSNRPKKAARWLVKAGSRGMNVWEHIAGDANFDGIRNHPALQRALDFRGPQNLSTDSD